MGDDYDRANAVARNLLHGAKVTYDFNPKTRQLTVIHQEFRSGDSVCRVDQEINGFNSLEAVVKLSRVTKIASVGLRSIYRLTFEEIEHLSNITKRELVGV